jgi:gliding motility-associated-like protein
MKRILSLILVGWGFYAHAQSNIAVYRYGDGSVQSTGKAAATFIDEYTPAGVFVRTIAALPVSASADGKSFALTGNWNSAAFEGNLTISADKRHLMVMGFNQAPGESINASAAKKVLGFVSADGSVNSSTYIDNINSTFRSAVTNDNENFWIIGSGSNLRHIKLGQSNGTSLGIAAAGNFGLAIFNNQLYISTTSSIATVSGGLPTSGTQTTTKLPGYATTGRPYNFVFFDTDGNSEPDLLYVADYEVAGGQVQKHVYDVATSKWIAKGVLNKAGVTENVRGITGTYKDGKATLFISVMGNTTTPSTIQMLENAKGVDLTVSTALTKIASAPVNTEFRSIALAPIDDSAAKAPNGLQTSASTDLADVTLKWVDNSYNETTFEIERSVNGTDFTLIGTVGTDVTTYIDKTLPLGAYYYRVRAKSDNGYSFYSNTSYIKTNIFPATPSALFGIALSTSGVKLSWVDLADDEIGYVIERSLNGVDFSNVATVYGININTYNDLGLSAGTAYYYRIKAISAIGASPYSGLAKVTTALTKPSANSYVVSNVITPNGDGINDTWVINNLHEYPNNEVKVLDKSGRIVFYQKSYDNTWNATYNGSYLSEGAYYYQVDLGDGKGVLKGMLNIIRRK